MTRQTHTSRWIQAPVAAAYTAFVDPGMLVEWLPPAGMRGTIEVFEPRVDGAFEMVLTYTDQRDAGRGKTSGNTDAFRGRFVELIPNEKVVWAVEFRSQDPGLSGQMRVIATFSGADGGVRVDLDCEDIPPAIRLEDNEAGSHSSLANLAALLEREA